LVIQKVSLALMDDTFVSNTHTFSHFKNKNLLGLHA